MNKVTELENALKYAAQRGVNVKIILPGIPDKKIPYALAKTHYQTLMESGVEIYEYTPGFVHAKSFVCDDSIATVGTTNMDFRSLYLNFECGAYLYGSDAVPAVKQDYLDTLKKCRRITEADCKTGIFMTQFQNVMRLLGPLI